MSVRESMEERPPGSVPGGVDGDSEIVSGWLSSSPVVGGTVGPQRLDITERNFRVQRPRYLVVEAGHLAGGAMSKQQAQIGTRRSVSRSLQSRLAVAVDYMAGFGFTHIKCVKQRGKESGLGDSSGPFGAT